MGASEKQTFRKSTLLAHYLARACRLAAIVAAVIAVFLGMDYELDAASFDEHANPTGFYISGVVAVSIYGFGRVIRRFGIA